MQGVRSYLGRTTATSLVNSLTSAAATAVFLPLVVERVGIEAYGLWATLGIFIGISSVLDFGIWKSVVLLTARDPTSRTQIVSSAALLCSAVALTFSLLLVAMVGLGVPVFGRQVAIQGQLTWWIVFGGCIIVCSSLITNISRGVLETLLRGHWVNLGYALLTLLQYGVAAVLAGHTADPRILIVGSACVYVAILIIHLAALSIVGALRWQAPRWSSVTLLLSLGWKTFASDLPIVAFGPAVMYLLLVLATDSKAFGIFDIALKVSVLAATTVSMLSSPLFAIVALTHQVDSVAVTKLVRRYLQVTGGLALLGWFTYWLVGKWLLHVFLGPASGRVFTSSLWLLGGAATLAAMEPLVRYQMGLGRFWRLAWPRTAMLLSVLVLIGVLQGLPVLDRFSIACAVAYFVAAAGVLASSYDVWQSEWQTS